MISEIQIGNFKAFGPAQTIPLRPITLVFGPNSAGKSSIIQSLLLARHIYDTGQPDAHQTTLGGSTMDLGGFTRYVHRHEVDRDTTIRLAFKRADIGGEFHYFDGFETLMLDYQIGIQDSQAGRTPIIKSVTLFVDADEVLRLVRTNDGVFQLDKDAFERRSWLTEFDIWIQTGISLGLATAKELRASGAAKLVEFAGSAGVSADVVLDPESGQPTLKGCLALIRHINRQRTEEVLKQVWPAEKAREEAAEGEGYSREDLIRELATAKFRADKLLLANLDPLPRENDDPKAIEEGLRWPDPDPIKFYYRLRDGDGNGCAPAVRYDIECLIEATNLAISRGIGSISYLGPLRDVPPRHDFDTNEFNATSIAGGSDAWRRLRREPEVLKQVNRFLRDTLHTRYRLECNRLAPALDTATIEQCIRQVREKVVNPVWETAPDESASAKVAENPPVASRGMPADADLAAAMHAELDARASRSTLTELAIVDADSNLSLSHRDVGTGISQLLPVIVNAVAAQKSLIAIEQPELHLHPALQAELADVFIESALGENKNTFLIETHSEHLILRIMRRIRESSAGRQPETSAKVRPEDVAILFVQPTDSGSVVKRIEVNERGELIDEWPGGFFEEGFRERFE